MTFFLIRTVFFLLANDGIWETQEDDTKVISVYSFKGKKLDSCEVDFDVANDLVGYDSKYNCDMDKFWGSPDREDVEGPTSGCGMDVNATRERWYRKFLILAIPPSGKFALLCKKGFNESLQHLDKNKASPDFQRNMETFLQKFRIQNDLPNRHCIARNLSKLMKILARSRNAELIKLYISYFVAVERPSDANMVWGLRYSENAAVWAQLLITVPWNEIKTSIETVIPRCVTGQYSTWLDVAEASGMIDITLKVAEVVCQRIKERKWHPQNKEELEFVYRLLRLLSKEESHQEKLPEKLKLSDELRHLITSLKRPLTDATGVVPAKKALWESPVDMEATKTLCELWSSKK